MLNTRDLRRVLDLVYAANEDTAGDISVPVLAGLADLVGTDTAGYTRVDWVRQELLGAVSAPADTNLAGSSKFREVVGQHPGFVAYRAGRLAAGESVALTQLADRHTLGRMPLYVDFYRPRGTRDQLLHVLEVGNRQAVVLTMNRSRTGFSARDRSVVELFAPHLRQALMHHRRRTELAALTRQDQATPTLADLTPREHQVVSLLAAGRTDREIARGLTISTRTVHKHLERIYRKLGTGSRTTLIATVLTGQ